MTCTDSGNLLSEQSKIRQCQRVINSSSLESSDQLSFARKTSTAAGGGRGRP